MDSSTLVVISALTITTLILVLIWLIPTLMCRNARKKFEEYLSQFSKDSLDYYIACYGDEYEKEQISENEFKYTWNIRDVEIYSGSINMNGSTTLHTHPIDYIVEIICDSDNKVINIIN